MLARDAPINEMSDQLLNSIVLQDYKLGKEIREFQESERAREEEKVRKKRMIRLVSSFICWPCTGFPYCFKDGGWKVRCCCAVSLSGMLYGGLLTFLSALGAVRWSPTGFIAILVLVIGILAGVGLCLKKHDCCRKMNCCKPSTSSTDAYKCSYTPISNQNTSDASDDI